MNHAKHLSLLLLLFFLLVQPIPAQEPEKGSGVGPAEEKKTAEPEKEVKPKITDPARCAFCKTTGKLPNPFYEGVRHLEEKVKYCSWCIEKDKKGCGLPWTPCWKCRNKQLKELAIAEFDKLVAERKAWLEKRREIDTYLRVKKPLLHLETEHFAWSWDIPKINFGKRTYRGHEAVHFFAELIENFYADFQKVHKISDKLNYNNHHELFIFERQPVAMRACQKYGEQASPNGKVTKQTKPSVFVTWFNKTKMPSAEDLHRDIIHNVAHLLTAVHKTWWWLYEAGFAYEGSAHWWENYYYKKATSYCFQEINALFGWISEKWESKVKKMVLANKQPSLAEMVGINGGSLTAQQHIFAWSYVDYMMFMDPNKTLEFFDILKQKRPAREAFLAVWKCSVLGFEQKWIEYVKAEYEVQEDAAPARRRWRR